jgi:hypothetical protein
MFNDVVMKVRRRRVRHGRLLAGAVVLAIGAGGLPVSAWNAQDGVTQTSEAISEILAIDTAIDGDGIGYVAIAGELDARRPGFPFDPAGESGPEIPEGIECCTDVGFVAVYDQDGDFVWAHLFAEMIPMDVAVRPDSSVAVTGWSEDPGDFNYDDFDNNGSVDFGEATIWIADVLPAGVNWNRNWPMDDVEYETRVVVGPDGDAVMLAEVSPADDLYLDDDLIVDVPSGGRTRVAMLGFRETGDVAWLQQYHPTFDDGGTQEATGEMSVEDLTIGPDGRVHAFIAADVTAGSTPEDPFFAPGAFDGAAVLAIVSIDVDGSNESKLRIDVGDYSRNSGRIVVGGDGQVYISTQLRSDVDASGVDHDAFWDDPDGWSGADPEGTLVYDDVADGNYAPQGDTWRFYLAAYDASSDDLTFSWLRGFNYQDLSTNSPLSLAATPTGAAATGRHELTNLANPGTGDYLYCQSPGLDLGAIGGPNLIEATAFQASQSDTDCSNLQAGDYDLGDGIYVFTWDAEGDFGWITMIEPRPTTSQFVSSPLLAGAGPVLYQSLRVNSTHVFDVLGTPNEVTRLESIDPQSYNAEFVCLDAASGVLAACPAEAPPSTTTTTVPASSTTLPSTTTPETCVNPLTGVAFPGISGGTPECDAALSGVILPATGSSTGTGSALAALLVLVGAALTASAVRRRTA